MFLDCSTYYSALQKQPKFDQRAFHKQIQGSLRASCPSASYQDYCAEYRPGNIAYRKVRAIPLALFAVLFKTVYHLGCAILGGLRDALRRDGKTFKANIYKVGRDFEEAFGYFVALVNDRRGTYIIQKSAFNKACYTIATLTPQQLQTQLPLHSPPKPTNLQAIQPPTARAPQPPQKAPAITTVDKPSGLAPEDKPASPKPKKNEPAVGDADLATRQPPLPAPPLITVDIPNPDEEPVGGKPSGKGSADTGISDPEPATPSPPPPLAQPPAKAPPAPVLPAVVSPYASMTDAELQELTVEQVKGINAADAKIITARLPIGSRDPDKLNMKQLKDILNIPIMQLTHLTADELVTCMRAIPENARQLLTPDQMTNYHEILIKEAEKMKLIEFRDLDSAEQEEYIQMFDLQKTIDQVGKPRFMEWLNKDGNTELGRYSLADLLEIRFKNSPLHFELMTDAELIAITIKDVVEVTAETRDRLMELIQKLDNDAMPTIKIPNVATEDDALQLTVQQLRFINSRQLIRIIKWLAPSVCAFLTDSQLKKMDIAAATQEQLKSIFFSWQEKENKRRIAMLSKQQRDDLVAKLDHDHKVLLLEWRGDLTPKGARRPPPKLQSKLRSNSMTMKPALKKQVTIVE